MRRDYLFGIAVVLLVFLGATFYAPISETFKGIVAFPSATLLAGVIFQIFRDNSMHQRNLELENEKQLFGLGAMSHMANTVFDNHVEFSEIQTLADFRDFRTLGTPTKDFRDKDFRDTHNIDFHSDFY